MNLYDKNLSLSYVNFDSIRDSALSVKFSSPTTPCDVLLQSLQILMIFVIS